MEIEALGRHAICFGGDINDVEFCKETVSKTFAEFGKIDILVNAYTAHFYTGDASSTFIISRGKDFIKAGIYGRNETPNMDAQIADKARNLAIALGGMVGISKIQWKILTDGLVEFRSW